MTEPELRRLAEIMTELSPEPSSFTFWSISGGVLVGFIGGFLANAGAKVVEWWRDHRAARKASRIELYQALVDFRKYMEEEQKPFTNAGDSRQRADNTEMARKRIISAIDKTRDDKYGRLLNGLISQTLSFGAEQIAEANKAIRRLEPQVLTVSEGIKAESSRPAGRTSRAPAKRLREWLQKLWEWYTDPGSD